MRRTRRIVAELPTALIDRATKASGKGLVDTLAEGLRLVKRAEAWQKAVRLRGVVEMDLDLDESRERRRR